MSNWIKAEQEVVGEPEMHPIDIGELVRQIVENVPNPIKIELEVMDDGESKCDKKEDDKPVEASIVQAQNVPPKPTEAAGESMDWAFDQKTSTWIRVTKASIRTMSANTRLASTTILEQFRDDLHPERPKAIEIGSRVYVRPLKVEGTVARITDNGEFRVDIQGNVQTFWPLELETLPAAT